jgi:hypothetical protein
LLLCAVCRMTAAASVSVLHCCCPPAARRDALAWLGSPASASEPLRHLLVEFSPVKLSTARVAFGLPQDWITTFEVCGVRAALPCLVPLCLRRVRES